MWFRNLEFDFLEPGPGKPQEKMPEVKLEVFLETRGVAWHDSDHEYDPCVICRGRTPYKIGTPIMQRSFGYVQEVGQYCERCWKRYWGIDSPEVAYDQLVSDDGYDLCIICREKTQFRTETPIEERHGYLEGSGQCCPGCYMRSLDSD